MNVIIRREVDGRETYVEQEDVCIRMSAQISKQIEWTRTNHDHRSNGLIRRGRPCLCGDAADAATDEEDNGHGGTVPDQDRTPPKPVDDEERRDDAGDLGAAVSA